MLIRKTLVGAAALAFAVAVPALAQDASQPGHEHKDHKQPEKAAAKAKVGQAAPAFEGTTLDGKPVKLADYKGKVVVLEWFNPGCPVVVGHYEADTMNKTIEKFKGKEVVWVRVNSGAAGKQGNGEEANRTAVADWNIKTPLILDESGTIGKAYGAKTTPHCFVIDGAGTLVYAGAIDNGSPSKIGDVNYVEKAVFSTLAGETVETPESKPYGCPVKY